MATANVANTKVVPEASRGAPYFDDYSEDKNFHRLMFRPGYAVQGRELTQLQTILQAQIERGGNHIFKNGSIVQGGQIAISDAVYLNLYAQYDGTDIDANNFVKQTLTLANSSNSIIAHVIGASDAIDTAPPVIVIKYLSGDEFSNNDTIRTASNVRANVAASAANGRALVAGITDGIFFMNGFYIKIPAQEIVIDKYSTQANAKIGIEFEDEIITEVEDQSLLDPAQEASNFQAPGAARYRVSLNLAKRTLDSEDDEQFVELLRLENGVEKKHIQFPIYSELGETFARRTFDESGSYTVRPFKLNIIDHPTDDTKLRLVLNPGKAYVKGYEIETIAAKNVDIPRARDTDSVNNFDVSMNYGNYFIGKDLKGVFDVSVMANFDIHCVNYNSINHASSATYATTKIGTGRIRNITFEGASNSSNANTHTHRISIFDTQFSNITGNANVVTSNSATLFSTTAFSTVNDAYQHATVRVIAGLGSNISQLLTVASYDGATRNLRFTSDFTQTPNANSTLSIDFDFGEAESGAITSYTAGSPSARANVNVDNSSKQNMLANGPAYLSESTLDSLVFPFPHNFIKQGSISDQDFQYRKKFTATFVAGTAQISVSTPDEAFAATNGSSSGTSTSTLENFIVIRDDNKNLLELTSVSVNNGTGTADFVAKDATFAAGVTIFASINLNSGQNINPKRKTLISGNTTHFVRSASDGSFLKDIAGATTNTTVYLTPGQVSIQNPSKVPGEKMSLYISDVKNIAAIYDLAGSSIPSVGATLSGSDVTSRYELDSGMKDSYYDHASLSLKPRVTTPSGPLIIVLNYYDHVQGDTSDGLGYFDVDSYPQANTTAGYAAIPSYTTSDGTEIQLRDAIDFRPRRQNAANTNPNYTLNGIRIPTPNESFEADYQYHLPRVDYVTCTSDPENPFLHIAGISSRYPQQPRNVDDAMVMYKLFVPAYTLHTANVITRFIENKRYTMRDIGVLESRIENLEYYVTLSMVEKSATDMVIQDGDGLDRTKYGILVDDFTGHGIGDVLNPDYDCSMDKAFGGLGPSQNVVEHKLYTSTLTNTKKSAMITTLDFSEETLVSQNLATKYVNVQPYMFAQWIGVIKMNPDSDIWVDTYKAPDVIINLNGVNDNFIQTGTQQTLANTHNNAFTGSTNFWQLLFGSR
jgi:hypothetical protein